MQGVFVIITKLISSKSYFCKVFLNNFGRDGTPKPEGTEGGGCGRTMPACTHPPLDPHQCILAFDLITRRQNGPDTPNSGNVMFLEPKKKPKKKTQNPNTRAQKKTQTPKKTRKNPKKKPKIQKKKPKQTQTSPKTNSNRQLLGKGGSKRNLD